VAGGCASATGRRAGRRGGDQGLRCCKGEKMRGLICMEAIGRDRVRRVVVIPYGSEGVSASMPGRAVSPAWAASVRGPPRVLGSRVRARRARVGLLGWAALRK
jgi:hypothetical protein